MQIQPVLFAQSHTLNCSKCNRILLEINFIDFFLKPSPINHFSKEEETSFRYYVLKDTISISSINLNSKSFCYRFQKSQTKAFSKVLPFDMLFIKPVTCIQCNFCLGYKIQTVTKDMIGCYDLLGRIIIGVQNVKIWAHNQDITEQMIQQFEAGEPNQNLSYDQERTDKEKQEKINLKQKKEKQREKEEDRFSMKKLKYSLQVEAKDSEEKELIDEIVSTVDFFTQVLDNLERRVQHTENICLVLKNKVERLVPVLRKS